MSFQVYGKVGPRMLGLLGASARGPSNRSVAKHGQSPVALGLPRLTIAPPFLNCPATRIREAGLWQPRKMEVNRSATYDARHELSLGPDCACVLRCGSYAYRSARMVIIKMHYATIFMLS
jgi:hypothetical protein